jgi:hypothetical protein
MGFEDEVEQSKWRPWPENGSIAGVTRSPTRAEDGVPIPDANCLLPRCHDGLVHGGRKCDKLTFALECSLHA